MKVNTPSTPNQRTTPYSSRLRNSVKRNLNSSFGPEIEESPSSPPTKSPRKSTKKSNGKKQDITLVINPKEKTCRFKNKHWYYESVSESESSSEEDFIVSGKRTIKTPAKYVSDEFVSPGKGVTPLKNKLQNLQLDTPRTPKYISGGSPPKKSKIEFTPLKNRLKTIQVSTPKTPRNTPRTPGSTLKLIREGTITPSVENRSRTINHQTTPLMKARSQLHVSYVPNTLSCREKEYNDVFNFLQGKLLDKCGGCMYISGVPGTGKTATVTSVINHLLELSEGGNVPKFEFVNVNGMKLTEPRQAYVEILKQLTNKTVTWQQAQDILEEKFTKKSKKPKLPVLLLIDELDIICNKRQDVVYNLLDWPTKSTAQLIVLTIANTMDLPERLLMNRVTSRLGLTRLTFQAYTHKQLQEIVTKRLIGTDSFNPDAVQLVARKVASISGDARRALDICRRAAEIAETEGGDTLVTMSHVNEALKMMMTQPKVRAIKHCCRLEQYILQAILAEMERTGIEETVFKDVYTMLGSLSALNGFPTVSMSMALAAIARLSACRLLLVDAKGSDTYQKIILNISPDDVYYALKEE